MFELVFATYLVLVLPVQQLIRSRRPRQHEELKTGAWRYFRTIRWLVGLLLVLSAVMMWSGRQVAELGLDVPVSPGGRWGLALGAVLLCLLFAWDAVERLRGRKGASQEEARAKLEELELIPRTPVELAVFIVLGLLIGVGTELLFRGFLLMVLQPLVGTAGAVLIPALAYGIGHGDKNNAQMVRSIISALLFTLAYALTDSLWWLMLLHTGVVLSMGVTGYRLLRTRASGVRRDDASSVS